MRILLFILALTATLLAQDTRNITFSVYLLPNDRAHSNASFERVEDIHYAYGDLAVPLQLKQARQSMAYPYKGGNSLSFFLLNSDQRTILCSTSIPEDARQGIILLKQTKKETYKAKGYWFGSKDLNGSVHFVNLSGHKLGLAIPDSRKKLSLAPQKIQTLTPPYKHSQDHLSLLVKGYKVLEDKESRPRLAFNKMFTFYKDNAHLVLITQTAANRFTTITLYANGVDNFHTLTELQKLLPFYRKSETAQKENPDIPGQGS